MTETSQSTAQPQTAPAPVIPNWVHAYILWIKSHEKLVIIAVGAFLLLHFYDRGLTAWEAYDKRNATQAAVKVQTDTTINKDLTDQLSKMKADADKRNSEIATEIKQALSGLAKQQSQDAQATQQQIVDRWKLLLPMKPNAVQTNGTVDSITVEAANQTVQALEQIPVLQTEVSDLNAKILIDDGIIGTQDSLIVGLNKQIIDEKASHVADVNLEKVKAKKSFIKGLKIGIVVGIVGTEAIRILTGRP
jgi:hypothetical protein